MLLQVENLVKHFEVGSHWFRKSTKKVHAVNGVSLQVRRGETLGIVGESGCGKTTLGLALLRLLTPDSGKIFFDGKDISHLSSSKLKPFRRRMQMIFQDPYASLNPRMTAGTIIEEPLIIHRLQSKKERQKEVIRLLNLVGLNESDYQKYPHEFSGGQRQRIGIARAIALKPDLIVADEPVSALDVSIQGGIINLLKNLQKQFGLTYIFISHDLKVVSQMSDVVAVMYLGKVVEVFQANDLAFVKHPYTQALLNAVPLPDPMRKKERKVLGGDIPSPIDLPSGCSFHPRCSYREEKCSQLEPELKPQGASNHPTACHFTNKVPQEIKLD